MSLKIAQTVAALPGKLDEMPCFHSNSPELVLEEGILISSFSEVGKKFAAAHLNFSAQGTFNLFFHHSTDSSRTTKDRTLYLAMVAGNAADRPVELSCAGVSFCTKPDAPFVVLETLIANDDKSVYAGPGDRVALNWLDGVAESDKEKTILLAAHEIKVIETFPLSKGSLLHPLNGRTGQFRFSSNGPIYLALVAIFAQPTSFFGERQPTANEIIEVLIQAALVQPRDKTPTAPGAAGELIYGRVAGVALGSCWRGTLANSDKGNLEISADQKISYPISTVSGGTLGTSQVQAADLLVRYPDTAYQCHGNYGVTYDLVMTIENKDAAIILVGLTFQSPLKNSGPDSLKFVQNSAKIVFRGTVKFSWKNSDGKACIKYFHLVQTEGMAVKPLIQFSLAAGQKQEVAFNLVYPADSTPPQVLTITATKLSR